METVLKVKNLYKEYKTAKGTVIANNNISFDIKKGEIVAVLGPNGAGKSTLVKQIIGYVAPGSGDIEIFGENIKNKDVTMLKNIGYMMQSRFEHWDLLSVYDAIYYSARLKKVKKKDIPDQMKFLLDHLDLHKELKKSLKTLSGGKKQAAALACAVVGDPQLVILDEPTNGLDPEKRKLLWEFLNYLSHEKNVTIIIITHNVNEIEEVADRVLIVGDGKIIKEGKPNQLKAEISNQMKIEIDFNEKPKEILEDIIKEYTVKYPDDSNKVIIYIDESQMVKCIENIFACEDISTKINNIQLFRPTLEDIYIKILG